jgi:hypothetical protein
LHEGVSQVEEQIPLLVGVGGGGYIGLFSSGLPAQFALVISLMQVAETQGRKIIGQRAVNLQAGNRGRLSREQHDLIEPGPNVGIRANLIDMAAD